MLKEEQYFLKNYRPPFKVFDPTKSVSKRDLDTNIHPNYREKSPKSKKVFIQPISANEKLGPKWG